MEGKDLIVQDAIRNFFGDNKIVFDKSRYVGGVTNYNYIMNIEGEEYVIRRPGTMTDKIIDRKIENINSQIAFKLGINSDCIYFDAATGIKFSKYISASQNVAQANPCLDYNINKVVEVIKKIHDCDIPFNNIFSWTKELEKYECIVTELNGDFFSDYARLRDKLKTFMSKNIKEYDLVPCHNDTVPENFIIDDYGKTYLIDWEYSGMNDHNWDVAAYIIESKLTESAINKFFEIYYGGMPTPEEIIKIKCYMMAQDMLWSVWSQIRHYSGDDFLEYFYNRYKRLQKNIANLDSLDTMPLSHMVLV